MLRPHWAADHAIRRRDIGSTATKLNRDATPAIGSRSRCACGTVRADGTRWTIKAASAPLRKPILEPKPEVATSVMSDADLSPDIRELLRQCINTYEKLHLLLLLRRKGVAIELVDCASELELTPRATSEALLQLMGAGFVVQERADRYQYHPRSLQQRATIDALALLFEQDPLRIVRWMSRHAFDRLHGSTANAFAEAVMTGRKKND